jgi:hypothetical protein
VRNDIFETALAPNVEGICMSRVRFTTARSVFETFPSLASKCSAAATDDPPIAFLKNLSAQEQFEDAVAFCAHMLSRREAVWWGCGTVRDFWADIAQGNIHGLTAAETWVHEPTDKNRLLALQLGNGSDNSDPMTWLALGAGWSGGMLTAASNPPVPVPHYLTARAVRIAILLSARYIKGAERRERMRACIAEGIKLAEAGDDSGSGQGDVGRRGRTGRFDTA